MHVSVPISIHSHIPSLYITPSSLHHFQSQFRRENYFSLWVKQLAYTHGGGGGKWCTFRGSEMIPSRLSNIWGSLSQVVSVQRQRGGPNYKVFIYNKFLHCRFRLGMKLGKWNTPLWMKGLWIRTHTSPELQTLTCLMPKALTEAKQKQEEEEWKEGKERKFKLCRPKTSKTTKYKFYHNSWKINILLFFYFFIVGNAHNINL